MCRDAKDIRAKYTPELCDQWLLSGYRAWKKRRQAKPAPGKTRSLDKKLAAMTPAEVANLSRSLRKR